MRLNCLLAGALLVISGCGTQTDRWKQARPETTLASGIVNYRDHPLAGAIVVFQPLEAGGVGASALTDEQGAFELKTFPPDSGVVPGEYQVSVSKTGAPGTLPMPEPSADPDPIRVVSLIPERYGIPAKSGLKAIVPPEGTDALVFELKD